MSRTEWVEKEFERLNWKDVELIEEQKRIQDVFNASMDAGYPEISSFGKNMLERLLKGLPLSKITEDDEWEEIKDSTVIKSWSSARYPALIKMEVENNRFEYTDVGRFKVINVNSKIETGLVVPNCDLCQAWLDLKTPIELPYMPPNVPWTFYVDIPKGTKKIHLIYLKNPELKMFKIDEYYNDMDLGEDAKQLSKKEWEEAL